MNRFLGILLSVALFAMLFGLASCGGSNDNAKLEGWWRYAEFSPADGYYAYGFDGGKMYALGSEANTQEAAIKEINDAITAGEGASVDYILKGDVLSMSMYDGVISWEEQLHVTFKGDTVVFNVTEEDFKHNYNAMKERYEAVLKDAEDADKAEIQKKYDEQVGSYDEKYKAWEADKDEPEVCVRFQPQK